MHAPKQYRATESFPEGLPLPVHGSSIFVAACLCLKGSRVAAFSLAVYRNSKKGRDYVRTTP